MKIQNPQNSHILSMALPKGPTDPRVSSDVWSCQTQKSPMPEQRPPRSGPLMPAETGLVWVAFQEEQRGQDRVVLKSYYFCSKKLSA